MVCVKYCVMLYGLFLWCCCVCVFSLHVLVRFVCDVLCDAVCGVCHCVWLCCLNYSCVLLVVYCDVVWFVICLRVLLCVCVFACLGVDCVCVLCVKLIV